MVFRRICFTTSASNFKAFGTFLEDFFLGILLKGPEGKDAAVLACRASSISGFPVDKPTSSNPAGLFGLSLLQILKL